MVRAVPVAVTAARQFRDHTGFPGTREGATNSASMLSGLGVMLGRTQSVVAGSEACLHSSGEGGEAAWLAADDCRTGAAYSWLATYGQKRMCQ